VTASAHRLEARQLANGRAGWTTEGDSAFNELSGSSPLSIRQQALRGIAKVALERGNKKEARHQYERILGKALIGRGPPAAHWAHSEYAWLLFEDGNLEVCPASCPWFSHLSHLEKTAFTAPHGCVLYQAFGGMQK